MELGMKKHKRIEITAFRRRIQITSGSNAYDSQPDDGVSTEEDIWINDASSDEAIEPESVEGRRILTEAVSLLQRRLTEPDTGEKQ